MTVIRNNHKVRSRRRDQLNTGSHSTRPRTLHSWLSNCTSRWWGTAPLSTPCSGRGGTRRRWRSLPWQPWSKYDSNPGPTFPLLRSNVVQSSPSSKVRDGHQSAHLVVYGELVVGITTFKVCPCLCNRLPVGWSHGPNYVVDGGVAISPHVGMGQGGP